MHFPHRMPARILLCWDGWQLLRQQLRQEPHTGQASFFFGRANEDNFTTTGLGEEPGFKDLFPVFIADEEWNHASIFADFRFHDGHLSGGDLLDRTGKLHHQIRRAEVGEAETPGWKALKGIIEGYDADLEILISLARN